MTLFMDIHDLHGSVTAAEVAKAHEADLATQDEFHVRYHRYWLDEVEGRIFCLVDAPSADAAAAVHRKAHGLVADAILPVTENE